MRIGRWSGGAGSGGCMGPLTSVLSPKRGEEERDGGDRPAGGRNVRVIAATKCKPPWRPSQRAEMYGTAHLGPLPETGRGGNAPTPGTGIRGKTRRIGEIPVHLREKVHG